MQYSAQWYELCLDDVPISHFRPGFVTVRPYGWSGTETMWWDPIRHKKRRSSAGAASASVDESDMGNVEAEEMPSIESDEEDAAEEGGDIHDAAIEDL